MLLEMQNTEENHLLSTQNNVVTTTNNINPTEIDNESNSSHSSNSSDKRNSQKRATKNAKKEDGDKDYEFNIDNNYVFSEYDMENGFPETLLDNEKYVSTLKYISEDLFVDTHAEYYIERQLNCYPQTSTFTKWKEENEIPLSAYQDTDEVEE